MPRLMKATISAKRTARPDHVPDAPQVGALPHVAEGEEEPGRDMGHDGEGVGRSQLEGLRVVAEGACTARAAKGSVSNDSSVGTGRTSATTAAMTAT